MLSDPLSLTISGTATPFVRTAATNPSQYRDMANVHQLGFAQSQNKTSQRWNARLAWGVLGANPLNTNLQRQYNASVSVSASIPLGGIGISASDADARMVALFSLLDKAFRDKLFSGQV